MQPGTITTVRISVLAKLVDEPLVISVLDLTERETNAYLSLLLGQRLTIISHNEESAVVEDARGTHYEIPTNSLS